MRTGTGTFCNIMPVEHKHTYWIVYDVLLLVCSGSNSREARKDDHRHLNQFIAHAALDLVDEHMLK